MFSNLLHNYSNHAPLIKHKHLLCTFSSCLKDSSQTQNYPRSQPQQRFQVSFFKFTKAQQELRNEVCLAFFLSSAYKYIGKQSTGLTEIHYTTFSLSSSARKNLTSLNKSVLTFGKPDIIYEPKLSLNQVLPRLLPAKTGTLAGNVTVKNKFPRSPRIKHALFLLFQ